jgi:hypothetical protein
MGTQCRISFQLSAGSTILDLKEYIGREKRKFADVNRQELRLEPKGKALKGSMLQNSISAKNFSDKFSTSNLGHNSNLK